MTDLIQSISIVVLAVTCILNAVSVFYNTKTVSLLMKRIERLERR